VPTLELNFTPLEAVLPVVNTHSTARLRLAEPELGSLQLSGSLRANNLPVLLQILESSYGVKAEHRPHGEIVLHR
jgi:ferric-dicitrate binding protein FerR (iron transport regulator)